MSRGLEGGTCNIFEGIISALAWRDWRTSQWRWLRFEPGSSQIQIYSSISRSISTVHLICNYNMS